MKKSSKADENPKINEKSPIHNAKIAHPWNKFLKFLMFLRLSILFSSISMYLGMDKVTGKDFKSLLLPSDLAAKDQKSTGFAVIWSWL
jgi:hypothetical protein